MATDIRIVEEADEQMAMHPKKFALWLFIGSVVMVFAALTSAYMVRQADGNWMLFDLPNLFWITSVIILVSSGTMHWAVPLCEKGQPSGNQDCHQHYYGAGTCISGGPVSGLG